MYKMYLRKKVNKLMTRLFTLEKAFRDDHYIDWEGAEHYIHVTQLAKKLPHRLWYCTLFTLLLILCILVRIFPHVQKFFAENNEALRMEQKVREILGDMKENNQF
jgi:hypothetical protein